MIIPKDIHKIQSLCESIFPLIIKALPKSLASRLQDVQLSIDNIGEINGFAYLNRMTGNKESLHIVVDSQLIEIMHIWCHLFGWVQSDLKEWSMDKAGQGRLSQALLELYMIQNIEKRLSSKHMKQLDAFASNDFFIRGYVHNHFLLLGMIQFVLCHELGHLYFRKRHFKNAPYELKMGIKGSYKIPIPQKWQYEMEADKFSSELIFSLNSDSSNDGYSNAMLDIAGCLFMNFLNVYEFILAHFVSVIRPDALTHFQRSHPPTRDRLEHLLILQQNSCRKYDIFRLKSVHQASLLNAVIMQSFYHCKYNMLKKYGFIKPNMFVEEPELFFYAIEEAYADIQASPRVRKKPRGITPLLRNISY